jgi:hypothetical protein
MNRSTPAVDHVNLKHGRSDDSDRSDPQCVSCELEYAVVSALVAGAIALVLLAVHHGTPSVFSNISTRLGM